MDKIYSRHKIRLPEIKKTNFNNKKIKIRKIYFMMLILSITIITRI